MIDVIIIFVIASVMWLIMGIPIAAGFTFPYKLHWTYDLLLTTLFFGPIGLIFCFILMYHEKREKRNKDKYWDNWVLKNCHVKNEKIK